MKTREWSGYLDKSEWGEGQWTDEPDKRQWEDAATGLPCIIVRGPSGSWCSYVGVSPGHPAYGLHYDGISVEDAERRSKRFRVAANLLNKGADFVSAMQKAYDGRLTETR